MSSPIRMRLKTLEQYRGEELLYLMNPGLSRAKQVKLPEESDSVPESEEEAGLLPTPKEYSGRKALRQIDHLQGNTPQKNSPP